jgi:hypothetical protein
MASFTLVCDTDVCLNWIMPLMFLTADNYKSISIFTIAVINQKVISTLLCDLDMKLLFLRHLLLILQNREENTTLPSSLNFDVINLMIVSWTLVVDCLCAN